MDKSSQPAVTDQAAPSVVVSEYDAQVPVVRYRPCRRSCYCYSYLVIHGGTHSRTLLVPTMMPTLPASMLSQCEFTRI